MSQDTYRAINQYRQHPDYLIYGTYIGNYTFNNLTYSIWKYIKYGEDGEDGEDIFVFFHPDDTKDKQCAIKFRIQKQFKYGINVFIDIFLCDIGSGIGRKMLKAFMNYLLNKSRNKIKIHNFTEDANICLTPGEIPESKRGMIHDLDYLIKYYRRLGFNTNINRRLGFNTNINSHSEICGTISNILNSIDRQETIRTPSITRTGKAFRSSNSITVSKMPTTKIPLQIKEETTPPTPPTRGIFSGFLSRFGYGGRKKQTTRKKHK
jgi:hypothetical protein